VYSFANSANFSLAYNTNLVSPKDFRSYWDLLNPKWKGKIVGFDPTSQSGTAAIRFYYYHPELGPEFLRRLLTEMDLAASRDERMITDWLAAGKYALAALVQVARMDIDKAKGQGLPVNWFTARDLKEGIGADSSGNLGIANRAPHPNAAIVAINWLLSPEGQRVVQKIKGYNSLRTDISTDDVSPVRKLVEGAKFLEVDTPEYRNMAPINELVQQVWKKK
jgi:ABC-type Fe3+ transport system substrate-binding protein